MFGANQGLLFPCSNHDKHGIEVQSGLEAVCKLSPSIESASIEGITLEPCRSETLALRFRPGPKQTRLYSHRGWLEISDV